MDKKDKLQTPEISSLRADLVAIRKKYHVRYFNHVSIREFIGYNETLPEELMRALLEKLIRQYIGYNFDAEILLMSFGLSEDFKEISELGDRREKFVVRYMEERCKERYERYTNRHENPLEYENDGKPTKGKHTPWERTKFSLEKDEGGLISDLAIFISEEKNNEILNNFHEFVRLFSDDTVNQIPASKKEPESEPQNNDVNLLTQSPLVAEQKIRIQARVYTSNSLNGCLWSDEIKVERDKQYIIRVSVSNTDEKLSVAEGVTLRLTSSLPSRAC